MDIGDFQTLLKTIDSLSDDEKAVLRRHLDAPAPSVGAKPRTPGLHEHLGHAQLGDDFFDELPDAFWLGEE